MRIPFQKWVKAVGSGGNSIIKQCLENAQKLDYAHHQKAKRSLISPNAAGDEDNYSVVEDLLFTSSEDQLVFPNRYTFSSMENNGTSGSGGINNNNNNLNDNGYTFFGKQISFLVIPIALAFFVLLLIIAVILCIFSRRRRHGRHRPQGRLNQAANAVANNAAAVAIQMNNPIPAATAPSSSRDIEPANSAPGQSNPETGENNAAGDEESQVTFKDGLGVLVTQLRRKLDAVNEYVTEEMETKFDGLDDKIVQMRTFRPLNFSGGAGRWGFARGGRMTKADMMRIDAGKYVSIQDGLKILRQKQLQLQKRQTQITYV